MLDRHGIGEVSVFGSVARGEDDADSDVDLAVEIPETKGLIALALAERELTTLLGVSVDLVPARLMTADVQGDASADLLPL